MWAPANLFNPFVNAIGLALKQATTFLAEHLVLTTIVVVLAIVCLVVVGQVRDRDRT